MNIQSEILSSSENPSIIFGSHDLTKLLEFIAFVSKFKEIERDTIRHFEGSKAENDAEHSRQLAVLSWYLNSNYNIGLDTTKILYYALAHDLVEIYAGDVLCFDNKARIGKKEREEEALKRIKMEVNFPELIFYIEQYEAKNDEESKFIFALDKIIAPLNIINNNGFVWKKAGISFETLLTKGKKVQISGPVEIIWKQIIGLIEKRKDNLFKS